MRRAERVQRARSLDAQAAEFWTCKTAWSKVGTVGGS
jgi:hypothetical protein